MDSRPDTPSSGRNLCIPDDRIFCIFTSHMRLESPHIDILGANLDLLNH
jgi:hypothetical protein